MTTQPLEMPMHRVLFAILVLSLARPLAAQSVASMDVTVGIGTGSGGEYHDRGAAHAELFLVPEQAGSRIIGLTIGARATPASGDVCAFDVTVTRCLDRFPALVHVGVLGGADFGPLRAMAGPAVYAGQGPPGVGGQLQLSLAAGLSHVAALAAARGGLVVRHGETLRLGSFEFGLRVR